MDEPMSAIPPASLLAEIRRDLRPVRPFLPPIDRAAIIMTLGLLVAAVFLSIVGTRSDYDFPGTAFVIAFVLRLDIGAALIAIGLREAVPSWGVTRRVGAAALIGGVAAIGVLPMVLARAANATDIPFTAPQLVCYRAELLIALPAFAVSYWLLARAYPLRPVFAALATATGVGLVADAGLFAHCPIDAPTHVLIAHEGAVVTIAVAGALAGVLLQRRKRSALPH